MKSNCCILILLLFALILKAEKYALLVGVGDYPASSGWQDLAGANDVIHLQEALKLHGFLVSDMTILVDQEATKNNIIIAFKQMEAKVKRGDLVVIHFSGHGQQIPDKNGDELDELDETFVPYDSPKHFQPEIYEGENLLLDDEINSLTYGIREKIGTKGQIVLILDSCHSGTGNRGLGRGRGTDVLMAPSNFETTTTDNSTFEVFESEYDDRQHLAPMGSYFGSSAKELNYEVTDDQLQPVGSLSYTIATLLAKLQEPISFQDFFCLIQNRMRVLVSQQHPQWDGPNSVLLFGKNYDQFSDSYSATFQSNNQIRGMVGTMRGIHEGSKVTVYSTNKARGSIAEGVVTDVDLTNSLIQLDTTIQIPFDEQLYIEVTTATEVPIKSNVSSQLPENSQWQFVMDSLQKNSFIEIIPEHADLFLTENTTKKALELFTREGDLLINIQENATQDFVLYKLLQQIKAYAQGKFLRGYEDNNSSLDFSIFLLPAEQYTSITDLPSPLGDTVFVGTEINIAIKNEGEKGAYFSLIDIQPNNQLYVLIPEENLGHTAADFYLKPGEVYVTDYTLEIGEPIGEETLKLVCTDQPLDINSIILSNGATLRGNNNLHPFEKALIYSYQNNHTRGVTINRPNTTEVGISTLNFRIEY